MNPHEKHFSMSAEEREVEIKKLMEMNSMTREEAEVAVNAKILGANASLEDLKEDEQPRHDVENPEM